MVTLSDFKAELTALDGSELLEVAMLGFDSPSVLSSRRVL